MEKAHHNLLAWQLALDLVERVYQITADFPGKEQYCLVSQMRRACVSVPANIAEGAARNSRREFRRFLCIARASLVELETLLLIAKRLEYTNNTDHLENRINRVFGLINGLIKQLKTKKSKNIGPDRIGEQPAGYLRLTSHFSPLSERISKPFTNSEASFP